MLENDLSVLLRIFIAMILTGILGWERESAGKAAGIRTHMLVGIGAVIFVALGDIYIARYTPSELNLRFDPIRIVEAVVTAIGFIGAGTIFVNRGKESVEGLTTAASIWTTAAVGMIVGLERYFLAVCATIIIFIILRLVTLFEPKKHTTEDAEKKDGI
jgi:putative Mg2+ transporter-C (MgtC) family protein